jgi:hypothetical protein
MGIECCCTTTENRKEIQRQILRFYKGKKIQIFNFLSQSYDECAIQTNISDFLGCSQIQIGSTIYLCGTSPTKNEYDSSFMYSIDTSIIPLKTKLEVNSFSSHYYPALTQYNNEYIFVIGGKRTDKCELYYIQYKKWRNLPPLPEERYGAVVLMHHESYSLYIIGGIDSESGAYRKGVLKLGLPSFVEWENVDVSCSSSSSDNNNVRCCEVAFSANACSSNNTFYILGGQRQHEEESNGVVLVTFSDKKMKVKQSDIRLPEGICFRYYKSCMFNEMENTLYYFVEKEERKMVKVNVSSGEASEFVMEVQKLK